MGQNSALEIRRIV